MEIGAPGSGGAAPPKPDDKPDDKPDVRVAPQIHGPPPTGESPAQQEHDLGGSHAAALLDALKNNTPLAPILATMQGFEDDPAAGWALFKALDDANAAGDGFVDAMRSVVTRLVNTGEERALETFDRLLAAATRSPAWPAAYSQSFARHTCLDTANPVAELLRWGQFSDEFLGTVADAYLIPPPEPNPDLPQEIPVQQKLRLLQALQRNPDFANTYLKSTKHWFNVSIRCILYICKDWVRNQNPVLGGELANVVFAAGRLPGLLPALGDEGFGYVPDSVRPDVTATLCRRLDDFVGEGVPPQRWMAPVFELAMLNQDGGKDDNRVPQVLSAIKDYVRAHIPKLEGGETLDALLQYQTRVAQWAEQTGKLFALYSVPLLKDIQHTQDEAVQQAQQFYGFVNTVVSLLGGGPVTSMVASTLAGVAEEGVREYWAAVTAHSQRKLAADNYNAAARVMIGILHAMNPESLPRSVWDNSSALRNYLVKIADAPTVMDALLSLRSATDATTLQALHGVMVYEALRDMKSNLDNAFAVWNAT
ncbi:MAG TPA: hypothetical protein VFF06_24510 [Polyangia bacterium]|nr:hypothetical protein [Polyangia bacterium]